MARKQATKRSTAADIKVAGNQATVTIDLGADGRPSKSGKTFVITNTPKGGTAIQNADGDTVYIQVLAYRYADDE